MRFDYFNLTNTHPCCGRQRSCLSATIRGGGIFSGLPRLPGRAAGVVFVSRLHRPPSPARTCVAGPVPRLLAASGGGLDLQRSSQMERLPSTHSSVKRRDIELHWKNVLGSIIIWLSLRTLRCEHTVEGRCDATVEPEADIEMNHALLS